VFKNKIVNQKNKFNTLFVKVFLSFWLLILLLSTALILLPKFDGRKIQEVTKNDIQRLDNQKRHVDKFLKSHPNSQYDELFNPSAKGPRGIYLTDMNGRLINEKAPREVRQFIIDSQFPEKPLKEVHKRKTYLGPTLVTANQQQLLLYITYRNPKESLAIIEWLIDNPLLLLVIALLISTPLCAFLAWHLTKPLRQLQNVANRVARGELDAPFPVIKNSEEITQLASSIQLMIGSLKNMLTNQQRLLSDISHELRSPLTRLRLALAINKKHTGDSKELQRIELETSRIEAMISELLNLSRIQLNPEDKETIPLNEFLDELFLDAQFEAKENGKIFNYPQLETFDINIYPELAYSAIENIIRNAIKYARHSITVAITKQKRAMILTIKNDGPLIPESELDNIFRPFYRLNESRDRESGGVGLGLSIAENAMFKHGGKIWAENIDKQVYMHLQFPLFS